MSSKSRSIRKVVFLSGLLFPGIILANGQSTIVHTNQLKFVGPSPVLLAPTPFKSKIIKTDKLVFVGPSPVISTDQSFKPTIVNTSQLVFTGPSSNGLTSKAAGSFAQGAGQTSGSTGFGSSVKKLASKNAISLQQVLVGGQQVTLVLFNRSGLIVKNQELKLRQFGSSKALYKDVLEFSPKETRQIRFRASDLAFPSGNTVSRAINILINERLLGEFRLGQSAVQKLKSGDEDSDIGGTTKLNGKLDVAIVMLKASCSAEVITVDTEVRNQGQLIAPAGLTAEIRIGKTKSSSNKVDQWKISRPLAVGEKHRKMTRYKKIDTGSEYYIQALLVTANQLGDDNVGNNTRDIKVDCPIEDVKSPEPKPENPQKIKPLKSKPVQTIE